MRLNRLWLAILLIPALAFLGCEGDTGPAGPPGEDVITSCVARHASPAQEEIELQYARSQHAPGEYVDYAGGRSSCARCHSGAGFVEYIENGDVDGNINVPVPLSCQHCHQIHETFTTADYALRTVDPVAFIGDAGYGDAVVDFGSNANACANCHQSRRAEPNTSNPGATFTITSSHYGPHHGAQANVMAMVGWAEIAGSTSYPATNIHLNAGADCITCHMGAYTDGAGGHTWKPNLAACQDCHTTADFDYGNVQTDVQAMLDQLRDLLLTEGIGTLPAIEWVAEDEAYEPIAPKEHDMVVAQAFFNWVGLSEDRSKGVHNPRYVEALLANSIEARQNYIAAPGR